MAWCPQCKNEYTEGITTCADCHCDLVDDLEAYEKKLKEEAMLKQEEELFEAKEQLNSLRVKESSIYVKKADKYQDLKFSALSFLIFGIAGTIFVILNFAGTLSLLNTVSAPIMLAVFIIFLVIGIVTILKANQIKAQIGEEESFTDQVEQWMKDKFTDDYIKTLLDDEQTDEINYFNATEEMKKLLAEQYPDLDTNYSDQLIDDCYNDFCERN